jgi:hypothetical protein
MFHQDTISPVSNLPVRNVREKHIYSARPCTMVDRHTKTNISHDLNDTYDNSQVTCKACHRVAHDGHLVKILEIPLRFEWIGPRDISFEIAASSYGIGGDQMGSQKATMRTAGNENPISIIFQPFR